MVGHGSPCLVKWKSRNITMIITCTLIFPLSVPLSDFHTHCFQFVCGTTLVWLALPLSPFSPLSPFLPWFPTMSRSPFIPRGTGSPFVPWIPEFALPRRPFAPSVSSWTRHSLRSLVTDLSLSSLPSLRSLRPGNASIRGKPFDLGMPGKPSIDRWKESWIAL